MTEHAHGRQRVKKTGSYREGGARLLSSRSCILGDTLLGRLELFARGEDQFFLEGPLLGRHFCPHAKEGEALERGQVWGGRPSPHGQEHVTRALVSGLQESQGFHSEPGPARTSHWAGRGAACPE